MTDPVPPVTPPGRRALRFLVGAAGYVAFAALALLVLVDGSFRHTDVVGEVKRQPASVRYYDGSTHYVALIHRRSEVLSRDQGYELYLGRYSSLSYGHFVEVGFTGPEPPVVDSVTWLDEGVQVRFSSGHEFFVPARYFTGGR